MWNFYPWGRGNRSVLGNLMNSYIGSGWWTRGSNANNGGCRCGCSCLLIIALIGFFAFMVAAIAVAVALEELGWA